MLERIAVLIQYLLPQHLLSTLAGWLAASRISWLKNFLISQFVAHYKVDMRSAVNENPLSYPTFNDFFLRRLKPESRPAVQGAADLACPVDGFVAEVGSIEKNQLLQAKNFYFDLETLLGDKQLAELFEAGQFATLYLAPQNYHRVHMPLSGTLEKTIYIPGKLFSVNRMTSQIIPQLYARNERVVCLFRTEIGPMAVILVGALLVGSMQTVWQDIAFSEPKKTILTYPPDKVSLTKSEEMGHFKMGSTVILLFSKGKMAWSTPIKKDEPIQVGQLIGNIHF